MSQLATLSELFIICLLSSPFPTAAFQKADTLVTVVVIRPSYCHRTLRLLDFTSFNTVLLVIIFSFYVLNLSLFHHLVIPVVPVVLIIITA